MENPYLLSVIWRQKVSLAVLKPPVLGNCFGGGGGGGVSLWNYWATSVGEYNKVI